MTKSDPKPTKRVDPLTQKLPRWKDDAENIDYLAALKFLVLYMDADMAFMVSNQFHDLDPDKICKIPARSLLHAAELPVLDRANVHVTHELVTIAGGDKLSPVLCLRGDRKRRPPLIVDGYYRICAAYHCDPDVDIPVKII